MSTSTNSPAIPMFNGENYHIWAVKMKFVLRSQGLWNVVISEADPPPLRENPTIAQIKAYEEEKLKKDKAITCLHLSTCRTCRSQVHINFILWVGWPKNYNG
uniref:DUF4219 domain-containing protein n=1 Tax=Cajanus cajan TaxID=3821 RepID=A0A151T578_CAJCA|nr:hypothetical protein KK1_016727 [Cajanus cajan]